MERLPRALQGPELYRVIAKLAKDTKKALSLPWTRALLAVGLGVTGNVLLWWRPFSGPINWRGNHCAGLSSINAAVIMSPTIPISIAGWGLREARWS